MTAAKTPAEQSIMTAAQAAKLVKRAVTVSDGGVTSTKHLPVKADEVMAFRDYGTHVVVVTTDGQKFSSAPVEAEAAA